MYFGTKSYLKRNRNHTVKHTLIKYCIFGVFFLPVYPVGFTL